MNLKLIRKKKEYIYPKIYWKAIEWKHWVLVFFEWKHIFFY